MQQNTSEKLHSDRRDPEIHSHSYAAHTGHDGEQHMKPQGAVPAASHNSSKHPTALRQPPDLQSRSGK